MGSRIAPAGAMEAQPGAKHGRQGRRGPVTPPAVEFRGQIVEQIQPGFRPEAGESSAAIQSAASATSEAGSAAAARRRLRGSAGAIAGMMPGRAPGTAGDGA